MPAPLIPKDEVLRRISSVFMQWGYDGATLAKLSQATGLVKASLYHYFPKGKQDMAAAVLANLHDGLVTTVLEPMAEVESPREKLTVMAKGLVTFYQEGDTSCVLELFSLGTARELFGEQIRGVFVSLRDTIAGIVAAAGFDLAVSLRRAEFGVSTIQGGLIMSRGLGDGSVFRNLMADLPDRLLTQV